MHLLHANGEQIEIHDLEGCASFDKVLKEEVLKDSYGLTKRQFAEGDVVLDIGAHIGVTSILLSKLHPQIKIIAFEPAKISYDLLVKNLQANNITNVVPIKKAVGSSTGPKSIKLMFNPHDSAGSSGAYTSAMQGCLAKNGWTEEEVECISMKDIFAEHGLRYVRWVKMDCEGAEWDIFADKDNMFDSIDEITMELHYGISKFARGTEAVIEDIKALSPPNAYGVPRVNVISAVWMLDSNG